MSAAQRSMSDGAHDDPLDGDSVDPVNPTPPVV